MRRLSMSLLVLPLLLTGCPNDPDGVTCAQSAGAGRVRIDIPSYQEGPKGDCEVDRGTVVTWRAPEGEPWSFEVEFVGAGPGGPGSPRTYTSRDRGDRQALSIEAAGPSGTYPYLVVVDGVELDPAIIIR